MKPHRVLAAAWHRLLRFASARALQIDVPRRLIARVWQPAIAGLLLPACVGMSMSAGAVWRARASRNIGQPVAGAFRTAGSVFTVPSSPAPAPRRPAPAAGTAQPVRCSVTTAGGPRAWLAAALAPVVRRHQGLLAVGVSDPASGFTAIYHGGGTFDTASIVKADILAVLLIQHQRTGTALSDDERELAAEMIEDSDNDAATGLWDEAGGAEGMAEGNAALGVHGVVPAADDYWGLTTTTVRSQLGLLSDLVSARSPLSAAARRYELDLMRQVEPVQAWGVTAAASPHTVPAVKNGWLPTGPYGEWTVNSIGVVSHGRQRLEIAVLSSGQPSMFDGIRQAEAAARAAAAVAASEIAGCHGRR
jgi:hypothetical protein